MNRLRALLGADRTVLLDGGMGTLLQDSGLEDGVPGELWNLENPDAVRAAHAAYAEAGSRLLTTNSFGGTRPRLDLHGLGDRVGEVNRAAAQLARSVADERGLIVARTGTQDRRRRLLALTPEGQELEANLFNDLKRNMARAYHEAGETAVTGYWILMQHLMNGEARDQFSQLQGRNENKGVGPGRRE